MKRVDKLDPVDHEIKQINWLKMNVHDSKRAGLSASFYTDSKQMLKNSSAQLNESLFLSFFLIFITNILIVLSVIDVSTGFITVQILFALKVIYDFVRHAALSSTVSMHKRNLLNELRELKLKYPR